MTEFLNHWRARRHHGSHRHLLVPPSESPTADVDAIIVPTSRRAAAMRPALRLARELNAPLLALCSKYSSARDVANMPESRGVRLIAIDAGKLPSGVLPAFETCATLARTPFRRRTDTSAKRNLGLLLARLIGWERVVFLDDDIRVPVPRDLNRAAGLTSYYAGVCLNIDGMPDNSVVCHAFREAGGPQDVFIGGGALAVAVNSTFSFFPNVYNEDWLFLLDDDGLQPTTAVGKAVQKRYDPFASDDRARREEFGDTIAEGLFWLLDSGGSIKQADRAFWVDYIDIRRSFIDKVSKLVDRRITDAERHYLMLASLDAARRRNKIITAELCVEYVAAWQLDRLTWRQHVTDTYRSLVVKKRKEHRDRRSLEGVRGMLRSLGMPANSFRLALPPTAVPAPPEAAGSEPAPPETAPPQPTVNPSEAA